ncbi:MAG: leucine-rich repeat protein, partial [Clostridia bacterium]|nr:leucine-rich repeat protein [Clostridia bacterium]
MKKKILLMLAMTAVLACLLALAVSAGTVHNSTTVDYTKTVTLSQEFTLADGTSTDTVPLFDGQDALTWYLKDGELCKIKTQDKSVKYDKTGYDLEYLVNVKIDLNNDGTVDVPNSNIVVLNLMDDDIEGYGAYTKYNELFNSDANKGTNLEYCYLRLDTSIIAGKVFYGCTKLKYVNLESLTRLEIIGQRDKYNYGAAFANCTSLFDGQLLDLSNTVLRAFSYGNGCGAGNFESVPISGIKLPVTFNEISRNDFKNCTKLTTIYFGKDATAIASNAFDSCTALKAIYFVGTEEQSSTSVVKSHFTDATPISYSAYENLADKSGKYLVYEYSSCSYNNGEHGTLNATANACIGICSVCGGTVVSHVNGNTSVTITYSNYAEEGAKTVKCNNEGCTYNVTEKVPALFTCLGYSTSEDNSGIATGFVVNQDSLQEYENTGKKITFGVVVFNPKYLNSDTVFTA